MVDEEHVRIQATGRIYMAVVDRVPRTHIAPVVLRPLEERDIAQATEIEQDTFPTLFPPTSFRKILKNRKARYLVGELNNSPSDKSKALGRTNADSNENQPLVTRIFDNARSMWSRPSGWNLGQQLLAGFVGAWHMVDEIHIVSVGVRTEYRGRGIGELLLIGAITESIDVGMNSVTLEVRVSNEIAKNLYRKYGFTERGLRKGYYSDDREDAVIMTVEAIDTQPYNEKFLSLVEAHRARWGYDVSDRS